MDNNPTFAISAAGMALERTRVEVAALNLANAHTAQTAGQLAYSPLRVVARPAAADAFGEMMASAHASAAMKPQFHIETAALASRMVHEPGHPMADARGFVSYPAVDPATEMVSLMSATRAYEANVAAMNAARTMALKALDIGGST